MSNLVLSDAGFIVYNMCINTKKRKGFWSISGRSFRPPRPEFPVPGLILEETAKLLKCCSAPGVGRSFRSSGPEFPPLAKLSGPRAPESLPKSQLLDCCSAPGVGRSFRPPRPEFPPLAKHSGPSAPEFWPESQL